MTIEKLDTPTEFQKYRTDWTEEDDGFWSGVGTVVDQVNLSYGDDVAEESRAEVFRGYEDYEDNIKYYNAYADNTSWYKAEKTEDLNRNIIEKHIENGRFTLDNQGNVLDTEDNWTTGMVFDMDMVKGALLAKQNGWSATVAKTAYKDFTTKRSGELQKEMEAKDVGLGQLALGMVAGHGFRETTLKEIAVSPQRVVGATIGKAALKAFTVEAGIAVAGEIERESQIAKHKELSDQEYGLWDSAKNIMIAAGFAGGIRAGGSAFVDWRTIKAIKGRGVGAIAKELEKKGIPVEDAKIQEEIVTRFMRREQYMLTNNTTKHVDIMHKAERDIDNGKPVDVTAHTEISVEDKVKELEATEIDYGESIDFEAGGITYKASKIKESDTRIAYELNTPSAGGTQKVIVNKETGEIETKILGEETVTISEDGMERTSSNIAHEVKVKGQKSNIDDVVENSLEQEVKSAPEMQKTDIETIEVKKTVDEAKPYNPEMKDDPFEGSATKQEGETVIEEAGNKAEYDEIQARIDELEKPISERQQQIQEAAVPKIGGSEDEAKEAVKQHFRKPLGDKYKGLSKEDIVEQDRMYKADLDMEANAVFAKFGDNLAAGTIAGIDEDEQGNITFNPEMFVAGLGGYTAIKALVKNKALRKTVGDSLRRRFNELDDNPMFNMIVGKQGMIDGRYKSDGLTKLAKKQADEFGFTEEEIADFDADDFQYFNKAARMIDNMDKDIKKDPLALTEAEIKAIEDAPDRPMKEIIAEQEEWEAEQVKKATPTYKKGDIVTAEPDPSITPYERPTKKGILARKAESKQPDGVKRYHPDRDKNYLYDKETDTVYFERAGGQWKEMPNEELRADIKYIDKHGVKAFRNKNKKSDAEFKKNEKEAREKELLKDETYKDSHTAPTRDMDGATSIDDLTAVYPSDIYGNNAVRYYGGGKFEASKDKEAIKILHKIKGNPKAKVMIYRSIPEDVDAEINVGDWVTITKQYAIEHADARFDGKYKLLEKEVNAEDIITDGNSIHEQGYDPKGSN